MNTPKRLSLAISAPKIRRKYLRPYSWLPDVFRLKGSIVLRIAGPVLTVTLFSTLICYLKTIGYHVVLTNTIVPMLSVVVGLILVFRSSYDRYWEGRKSWSTLTANIRNLARQIWINTAYPPQTNSSISSVSSEYMVSKKREAIQLLIAFPFAVKHYLREEEGMNWSDLQEHLPASFFKYVYASDAESPGQGHSTYNSTAPSSLSGSMVINESIIINRTATKRVRPKRSKTHLPTAQTPLLATEHQSISISSDDTMPLPLLISHEISRILFFFRREGFLEVVGPAGTNAMAATLSSIIEQLSAMERVANTPIPVSYSIHLKQCVTLYLFALPLTLVTELGWATIPIVTVVAFTFMGIEGIADEIEMPFGNDPSDLPLDRYCWDLKEELSFLLAHLPDGGIGTTRYDDGEGDD